MEKIVSIEETVSSAADLLPCMKKKEDLLVISLELFKIASFQHSQKSCGQSTSAHHGGAVKTCCRLGLTNIIPTKYVGMVLIY